MRNFAKSHNMNFTNMPVTSHLTWSAVINEIQKHVSDQSNSVVNDMKHTYYESVNTHTTNSVICLGDT